MKRIFACLAIAALSLTVSAAPLLDAADRTAFNDALQTQKDILSPALDAMLAEVRARFPFAAMKSRAARGNFMKNDYRNYQWLVATTEKDAYFITTFFNDIDLSTGNLHTQPARLQFWRHIHDGVGPHERNADGTWRFAWENHCSTMPMTRFWKEEFSARDVARMFRDYLRECGDPAADAYIDPAADAPAPAPLLDAATRARLEAALETVRVLEGKAMNVMCAALRERFPEMKFRMARGQYRKNDYRGYQWIVAEDDKSAYLVCFFHNDLDERTGNPHTQYGRIQFWRDVNSKGDARLHEKKDGKWTYNFSRSDASLPIIRLWNEDCTTERLCDLFAAWVSESSSSSSSSGSSL